MKLIKQHNGMLMLKSVTYMAEKYITSSGSNNEHELKKCFNNDLTNSGHFACLVIVQLCSIKQRN